MERDFSEASKQRLIGLVDEVENDKWCDFTDFVGDRWYDFESWIGQLNLKNYLNNVNDYHKKVIDKNNTSKSEIEGIFTEVNAVSDRYKVRFAAMLSQLKTYRSMISSLSDTVNPAHGMFNSMYIGNSLVGNLIGLLQSNKALKKISGNGITNDELSSFSDDVKAYIISRYVSSIVDALPNFKVGTKDMEIPIGPDVTIYYSVEGKFDNDSDININMKLEDHKVSIKNFSTSTGDLFGIGAQANSDGKISVTGNDDNGTVSFNNLGGISNGRSVEVNGSTFSFNFNTDPDPDGAIDFSEHVRSDFDSGYIESTIGIKKHSNKDSYVPLPVPEGETVQNLSLSTPEGWYSIVKILINSTVPNTSTVDVGSDIRALLNNWQNSSVFDAGAAAAGSAASMSIINSLLPALCLI